MQIKKLFEIFPPPKFLDIPYAGISINDTAIRAIQFVRKNGRFEIEKYSEKILPQGLIVGGEVMNKQEIIANLLSVKEELGLEYVKVSIPEEKSYLFTAKIPIVPPKEVVENIEKKIEENVPVPSGELIFDYIVSDWSQDNFLRTIVLNLPIKVAETYVEIIQGAGLKPFTLEIESQAIVRAVVKDDKEETVLVVNIMKNKVGLYVVNKKIINFSSTLTLKGDLENDQDMLSHEIKKLYAYWHSLKENIDKPEKQLQEIIICGENVSESVLPYLSTHHNTKVSLANVWINSFDINETVPVIDFNSSLKYPAAIGLALRQKSLI
jgi:Tfp pilus assembly PilM family ATPase